MQPLNVDPEDFSEDDDEFGPPSGSPPSSSHSPVEDDFDDDSETSPPTTEGIDCGFSLFIRTVSQKHIAIHSKRSTSSVCR